MLSFEDEEDCYLDPKDKMIDYLRSFLQENPGPTRNATSFVLRTHDSRWNCGIPLKRKSCDEDDSMDDWGAPVHASKSALISSSPTR